MPHLSLVTRSAIALAALSASCASREIPARFPARAPASLEAQAAKPAEVTQSLQANSAGQADGDPAADVQRQQPAAASHEGHHGQH
jgi:hypothetical protein